MSEDFFRFVNNIQHGKVISLPGKRRKSETGNIKYPRIPPNPIVTPSPRRLSTPGGLLRFKLVNSGVTMWTSLFVNTLLLRAPSYEDRLECHWLPKHFKLKTPVLEGFVCVRFETRNSECVFGHHNIKPTLAFVSLSVNIFFVTFSA